MYVLLSIHDCVNEALQKLWQIDQVPMSDTTTSQFPQAAQVIIEDFYMDDYLSGADSVEAEVCRYVPGPT